MFIFLHLLLRIVESFELERTFKLHLVQLPCNEQGHLELHQVLRALTSLTLSVCRYRAWASTTYLCSLFYCLTTLIVKNSACLHRGGVPSLGSFLWPSSGYAPTGPCLSYWGLHIWTQYSRWGLTSAEQKGRITSLHLLATLLLMQPRIQLAFWTARAHRWLMSNLPSTSTPMFFLQVCTQSLQPCTDSGGSHDRGARHCTWTCWIFWGSLGPTDQACLDLSESHLIKHVKHTTQLSVTAKFADTVYVTNKDVK